MEKVRELLLKANGFIQRARKLIASIVAGLAPILIAWDRIFADGQINGDDTEAVITIVSIVLGFFGVYVARNKVGAVSRRV